MRSLRPRFVVASVVVVGTSFLIAAAARPKAEPECVVARRWVSDHVGKLPTTLEGLAGLSPAYRRAVHNALPAIQQRDLWYEHYHRVLATGRLSPWQQTIVRDWADHLNGFYAEGMTEQTRRERAYEFVPLMYSAFSPELRRQIFHLRGLTEESQIGLNTPAKPLARFPDCNCHFEGANDCTYDGDCELAGAGCLQVEVGCSINGWSNCDGYCTS